MRSSRALASAVLVVLPVALVGAPAAAQTAQTVQGGDLGGSITYTVTGTPGELFFHLPSFGLGPTPVGAAFPPSPLVLGVGIDLFGYAQVGIFAGAPAIVSYPLPASPAALGVPLNAQVLTFALPAVFPSQVSNRTTTTLGLSGSAHQVLGEVVSSRQGHTVTALDDGRVLVLGGDQPDHGNPSQANLTTLDTAEIYDPQTETFALLPATMTQKRSTHTATKLADGRVLIVGGFPNFGTGVSSATAEIFDPATNTFAAVASPSVGRTVHTATLLADGRVYVTGGAAKFQLETNQVIDSLASVHATTEVYDPVANTWTAGPSFALPLGTHGASRLPSGKVLICGGVEIVNIFGAPLPVFSAKARIYDPGTNTFSSGPNIPIPAAQNGIAFPGQATLASGKVLVAGGANGELLALMFNTRRRVFTYDEPTNAWTEHAQLPSGRANAEILQRGNDVWIAGGLASVDIATGINTPAQTIERSDTSFLAWTTPASMLLPREVSKSVFVNEQTRILSVGNGATGTPTVDSSAEYFTP